MKWFFRFGSSLILVVGFVYWLVKHSGFFPYEQNPMQYMPDMHYTPALKPERNYPFYKNDMGARVPPSGTLAIGTNPYGYTKNMPAERIPRGTNPLAKTRTVVERGQQVYNNFCIVCHGRVGLGDGSIVPPFQTPPSLVSSKLKNFSDRQLFHIVTVGQNNMPGYMAQIREKDRWSVIHYIRVLQLSQDPPLRDVEIFEKVIEAKK